MCTPSICAAVQVEFLTEPGDLPLLRSDLTGIMNIDPVLATYQNGYLMNITEFQKGRFSWCYNFFALIASNWSSFVTSICWCATLRLTDACIALRVCRYQGGDRVLGAGHVQREDRAVHVFRGLRQQQRHLGQPWRAVSNGLSSAVFLGVLLIITVDFHADRNTGETAHGSIACIPPSTKGHRGAT